MESTIFLEVAKYHASANRHVLSGFVVSGQKIKVRASESMIYSDWKVNEIKLALAAGQKPIVEIAANSVEEIETL